MTALALNDFQHRAPTQLATDEMFTAIAVAQRANENVCALDLLIGCHSQLHDDAIIEIIHVAP